VSENTFSLVVGVFLGVVGSIGLEVVVILVLVGRYTCHKVQELRAESRAALARMQRPGKHDA